MAGSSRQNGLSALVAALAVLLVLPGVAAARSRPDLRVTRVTGAPGTVSPGARFTVHDTVLNAGGRSAGRSVTTFALSRAGHRGRLKGTAKVKRLRAHRRAKGKARLTVPAGVAPGSYRLLACADGRRRVRERDEHNNCRAARGQVRVVPAPAVPPPAPKPKPTPTPTASPHPGPTPPPPPAGDPPPDYRPPSAPAAAPLRAVAVTAGTPQHVVTFAVDAPGTLLSDEPIALQDGEHVLALDQQASTGRLIAHTDTGRVLSLDPATGAVTAITTADLGQGPLGEDIDPVGDRLHATDGSARHAVVDLGSGSVDDAAALSYLPGDPGAGATPALDALAFTDSAPGAFGARLYGIDPSGATAKLVEVTDQALGLVRTVGDLGVGGTGDAGFDIDGTSGAAYAVLTPGAESGLYRVNLDTGHATAVGTIGSGGDYRGLALLPTPAGTPPPAPIQAFSDGWMRSDPTQLQFELDPSVCAIDEPYHAMTEAAALASLHDFLLAKAGQAALDAVAGSPQGAAALTSVEAAAVAVRAGSPGAALAALLRAHQLAPDDPSVLLDVATLAGAVGKPSEALALIAAAEGKPAPPHGPMGLSWTGRLQLARAQAFASLAQWTNAERAARAAEDFEPALTQEAAGILAAVSLCRDHDPSAAAVHAARAEVRNDPPQPIDESQGSVHPLRNLPYPALPENAAADHDFWNVQMPQELQQEALDHANERNRLAQLVDKPAPPAEMRRHTGLRLQALQESYPDSNALSDRLSSAINAANADMSQFTSQFPTYLQQAEAACYGSSDDTCLEREAYARCSGPMNLAYSAWLNDIGRADDAGRRRQALLSRRMSGIAANIGDPDEVAYVANEIESLEITTADMLTEATRLWVNEVWGVSQYCVDPPPPPDVSSVPTGGTATAQPCPPALQRINAKADILEGETEAGQGFSIGAKANCSEVSGEGSVGVLPFISAFGNVSYAPKSGQTTVVLGGQAKIGGGPFEASFQSGIYMKFDAHGDFQDVGWRIGPGMSGGTKIVEYAPEDTMDLSFVEGVRALIPSAPSGAGGSH